MTLCLISTGTPLPLSWFSFETFESIYQTIRRRIPEDYNMRFVSVIVTSDLTLRFHLCNYACHVTHA
jgi:hypothetical protein